MLAAIFNAPRQNLELKEIPNLEPSSDDIVVRVEACGLCHTDLHYIDHGVPTFKKPPMILGHEAVGVVSAVGSKVDNFKKDDHVLIPAVLACHNCDLCSQGRTNICMNMQMLGNHIDGAFAQFCKVPARDIVKLPPDMPLEESAVIADALSTAYHAVIDRAKPKAGDWVAVFGCGGVGANVIQVAAHVGCRVIAVDVDNSKLELAKYLGAAELVNPSSGPDSLKGIRKLTGGGAHVAFECIGKPATIKTAHDVIRRGGKLCIVGYCQENTDIAVSKVMFFEQAIVGSLGCPVELYPEIVKLVHAGQLKVSPLVTKKFPLSQINDAFDLLRKGAGLRNIVLPWA